MHPRQVVLDFEVAAHQDWMAVRPNIRITGCPFHFGQSIWRKLQTLEVSTAYKDDTDFQ